MEEDFVRINVVSGVRERVHGLRGDGLVIGMGVVIPVSTLRQTATSSLL